MERILIPTDFSSSAKNAIRYAMLFFKGEACTIQLLNTYTPDFINSRVMALSSFATLDEDPIQQQSELGLRKIVMDLEADYPDSKFSFETFSSFSLLTEEIRERSETDQIDVIVSGTRGASGLQEIFLGSNTVRIIKAAGDVPVLVIPQEAQLKVPARIGFATDFNSAFTGLQLDSIHYFTTRYQSKLVIFHLGKASELSRLQQMHKRQLDLELERLHPEMVWLMETESMAGTLQQALVDFSIDFLTLIRNERHLPATLLREPVVKRMVFHTEVPLLVLPSSDYSR